MEPIYSEPIFEENGNYIVNQRLGIENGFKVGPLYYDITSSEQFSECGEAYSGTVALMHIDPEDESFAATLVEAEEFGEIKQYLYIPESVMRANEKYKVTAIRPNKFGQIGVYIETELPDIGVVLPKSITKIGRGGINSCGIHDWGPVILSNSIEEIGESAMTGLNQRGELKIPKSVRKIGYRAFRETICDSLDIKYVKELSRASFESCTILDKTLKVPGVEIIPEDCFRNCTTIKKLIIGEGCKEIHNNAFANLISLQEVIIPNTMERINRDAFRNCYSLKSVAVPMQCKIYCDDSGRSFPEQTEISFY